MEKKFLKYIIFSIWILVSLVLLYNHEMWRDEADVWLMVRDLNFLNWREYLRHCGHPALWFILIYPFVKIGFSVVSMQMLNFIFAVIATGKLLFQSKIQILLSATILFGSYFLYRFPSFARNYSIGLLLLFIVITGIFQKKISLRIISYISLLLLVHTHILFTLIAIAWGVLLIFEGFRDSNLRKERFIVSFLLLLSGLLFLYLIYPPSDSQFGNSIITDNPSAWRISLTYTFLPNLVNFKFAYYLIWIFLFLIAIWSFPFKRIFIYYLSGLLFFLFFFRFVYVAHIHHLSVLFVFILSVFWLRVEEDGIKQNKFSLGMQGFLFLFAISHFFYMFTIEIKDLSNEYSGAKEASKILTDCGYQQGNTISAHTPDEIKSILLYLPPKTLLYYPSLKKFGSFMNWNQEYKQTYFLDYNDQVQLSLELPKIKYIIINKALDEKFKEKLFFCGSNIPDRTIEKAEIMYVYKKL